MTDQKLFKKILIQKKIFKILSMTESGEWSEEGWSEVWLGEYLMGEVPW